jgi:hypothetical protein
VALHALFFTELAVKTAKLATVPINSSISVIWKQQDRATSHVPPGAFPITSVYRKFRGVDNLRLSLLGESPE